jgi:uncharacterized membrane-anchored protein
MLRRRLRAGGLGSGREAGAIVVLQVWRVILTFFQKTNSAGQMLMVL